MARMLTRPLSKRQDSDRTIAVPHPVIRRTDDGTVQREADKQPIYDWAPLSAKDWIWAPTISFRFCFVDLFCHLSSGLTLCDVFILAHLLRSCPLSRIETFFQDNTYEPQASDHDGSKVVALFSRSGNLTGHFTRRQLRLLVHATEHTVRDSLHRLTELGLVRRVNNDKPEQAKRDKAARKRGAGKPEELMRFEIHPEIAWRGSLYEGVAYANQATSFDITPLADKDSGD